MDFICYSKYSFWFSFSLCLWKYFHHLLSSKNLNLWWPQQKNLSWNIWMNWIEWPTIFGSIITIFGSIYITDRSAWNIYLLRRLVLNNYYLIGRHIVLIGLLIIIVIIFVIVIFKFCFCINLIVVVVVSLDFNYIIEINKSRHRHL